MAGVGEYFQPAAGIGEYFAANGLGADATTAAGAGAAPEKTFTMTELAIAGAAGLAVGVMLAMTLKH